MEYLFFNFNLINLSVEEFLTVAILTLMWSQFYIYIYIYIKALFYICEATFCKYIWTKCLGVFSFGKSTSTIKANMFSQNLIYFSFVSCFSLSLVIVSSQLPTGEE